jgi:hypothetical protein
MLPPGHFAAGYLVAEAVIHIAQPNLTTSQTTQFLFLGGFFGFVPDLDMFYAFFKAGSFTVPGNKINHRKYFPHTPILWLIAGLAIYFLVESPFLKYTGLLVWLGAWSHFVLDSFKVGIRWLYPFTSRFFALENPGEKETNNTKGFFKHWMSFIKYYATSAQPTFYLELVIIATALIVYFR